MENDRLLGEWLSPEEETKLDALIEGKPTTLWGAFLESELARKRIDSFLEEENALRKEALTLAAAMLECGINVCKTQIDKLCDPSWNNNITNTDVIKRFVALGGGQYAKNVTSLKDAKHIIPHPTKSRLKEMVMTEEEILKRLESAARKRQGAWLAEAIRLTEKSHYDDGNGTPLPATDNCEQAIRDAYEEAIISTRIVEEAIKRKVSALQRLRQLDQISEYTFQTYWTPGGDPRRDGIWYNYHNEIDKNRKPTLEKRESLSGQQREALQGELDSARYMHILRNPKGSDRTIIRTGRAGNQTVGTHMERSPAKEKDREIPITFEDRLPMIFGNGGHVLELSPGEYAKSEAIQSAIKDYIDKD